jgi:hypothetical protein
MADKTSTDGGNATGATKRFAELAAILEDIRREPTVRVWPHAGRALGLSRGSAYAAAARGEIDAIRIGRSVRAVSASLRKRLGLEESNQ